MGKPCTFCREDIEFVFCSRKNPRIEIWHCKHCPYLLVKSNSTFEYERYPVE